MPASLLINKQIKTNTLMDNINININKLLNDSDH